MIVKLNSGGKPDRTKGEAVVELYTIPFRVPQMKQTDDNRCLTELNGAVNQVSL